MRIRLILYCTYTRYHYSVPIDYLEMTSNPAPPNLSMAVGPLMLYLDYVLTDLKKRNADSNNQEEYDDIVDLRDLLEERDPEAIDVLLDCIKKYPDFRIYDNKTVLNDLRSELGVPIVVDDVQDEDININTDRDAITALEYYRNRLEEPSGPKLPPRKKRDALNTIDDAISFINIPAGTDVDFDDVYPEEGLRALYAIFPEIYLKKTIEYVHSMLPDASEDASEGENDLDQDFDKLEVKEE